MQQLVAKFLRQERDVLQDWLVGSLNYSTHFGGGIKHCKSMVLFAEFPLLIVRCLGW